MDLWFDQNYYLSYGDLSFILFSIFLTFYANIIYGLEVDAASLRRKSLILEEEEDKSNRPKRAFQQLRKKTIFNCQNTIFGFTKVLWLIDEKNTLKQMIIDKDGKAMIEKYLSVSSLLLQYHFEFICFVDSLSKVKVSKILYLSVSHLFHPRVFFISIYNHLFLTFLTVYSIKSDICYTYCHSLFLFLFLFLSLSVSLFLSLSISLYLYLSILSLSLTFLFLSISLSSLSLSFLSVSISLSLSLSLLPLPLCVCVSVCLSVYLSIFPSSSLSFPLPLSLFLSKSLFLSSFFF